MQVRSIEKLRLLRYTLNKAESLRWLSADEAERVEMLQELGARLTCEALKRGCCHLMIYNCDGIRIAKGELAASDAQVEAASGDSAQQGAARRN